MDNKKIQNNFETLNLEELELLEFYLYNFESKSRENRMKILNRLNKLLMNISKNSFLLNQNTLDK